MASTSVPTYRGQVVYLFAFDVAHDMKRVTIPTLLGQPVTAFTVGLDKRTPRQPFFYQPQMVRLPAIPWAGPLGPTTAQPTIKIFPVGALSIALRLPFETDLLDDLIHFHEFDAAHHHARDIADRALRELQPYLIRPLAQIRDEEAYTVFCIESSRRRAHGNGGGAPPDLPSAEEWFNDHRSQIAALLVQEDHPAALSEQEVGETTSQSLSYYRHDLIITDWDAALILDEPSQFEPTLHIMELANVQLTELEAYDRLLDEALERAYRDLIPKRSRAHHSVLRTLRELRIDMARLSDELSNITKFFGDWHLARLYQSLYFRFHLADWNRTLETKLRTLDDLYRILAQDRMNVWMVILEATIVGLFIVDLVLLALLGSGSH